MENVAIQDRSGDDGDCNKNRDEGYISSCSNYETSFPQLGGGGGENTRIKLTGFRQIF